MLYLVTKFSEKLNSHLDEIGWSRYRLAKESDLHEQYVYPLLNGKKRPSDPTLEKLANTPGLGLTLATLRAWRALDDYSEDEWLEALRTRYSTEEELESFMKKVREKKKRAAQ